MQSGASFVLRDGGLFQNDGTKLFFVSPILRAGGLGERCSKPSRTDYHGLGAILG